jgi:hypothetical protein
MNVRRFHAGWIWDLRWISANIFASAADDFTIKICRVGRDAPLHTLMHHVRPQKFRYGISPSLHLTVLFLIFAPSAIPLGLLFALERSRSSAGVLFTRWIDQSMTLSKIYIKIVNPVKKSPRWDPDRIYIKLFINSNVLTISTDLGD